MEEAKKMESGARGGRNEEGQNETYMIFRERASRGGKIKKEERRDEKNMRKGQ